MSSDTGNAPSRARYRHGGCGFAAALVLGVAAPAHAAECEGIAPEVERLLAGLGSSAQQVVFSGVVTLQRGGDMQIMEVSHRVEAGVASDTLSPLTGSDARVERAGHDVDCLHPGHQLMRAELRESGSVCELAQHYRFELVPGEPIAGREATRLRVEPRDVYRYGYVFDVDSETSLMLRSTTLAADRRVLEQFQFANLRIGTASAPAEAPGSALHAQHPHPEESSHLRQGRPWELAWLPAGFVPTDAAPASSPRKTFTDGLASFSVFLERLSRPLKPGEGVERQGSTIAYTRGMQLQGEPVLVTVLGEVPTNTARMVADSVRMR